MQIRIRPLLPVLLAVFASPVGASAQTGPALALETNRFYTEQGPMLVEGAVEVPYPLLTFASEGENLKARALVEVMIDRASGDELYHTEHEIEPEAINQAMATSDRVSSIETFAVYAPPGEYVARARVTDLTTDRTFEMSTPLVLPDSPPLFSDIVLSSHVQKNVRLQEGSYLPYLIGTTMFNPNPRRVFFKDAPLLYFYYEINPEALNNGGESVSLQLVIADAEGEVVKDLGTRGIQIDEDRNFDIGAFSVAGLAPGRYSFEVRCQSCDETEATVSAFEVHPRHAEQLAFLQPPAETAARAAETFKYYSDFSEAQVDSVIDVVQLLFTQPQKDLIKTLNRQGKISFLNRFWDSADQDPETEVNEFKQAFEQRVAYADTRFSNPQRIGHDSDRGHIYVLFGHPSEIVDRPVEATVGPYVIWNFANVGHTFAFGDFRKDGSFELIYSTHEDFPGDPSIQQMVDTDDATAMPSFLRTSRGYERVILDIQQYRLRSTAQF